MCNPITSGAPGRTRTPNLRIRSPPLYPIELQGHAPEGDPFERVKGIEPSPPAWKAGALPLSYTREQSIVRTWSGWSDSNRRPRRPKRRALTKLRHSPSAHRVIHPRFLSHTGPRFDYMELEASILGRVRGYVSASRWERAELGRDLRRLGLSYGEIIDLIPVKKSTLATWCRDVRLTEEQIEAIRGRRASEPGIPRDTQRKRRREVELISSRAQLEAKHLVEDPFWVAGVVLYWGEGSKTKRRLAVANADPAALRLFRDWSARFHQTDGGWRARLNLHANNDELAARFWWAAELSLSIDDFTKTFIKPDGTGHRKNHLPYGVCTLIRRRSADDFIKTMAWIEFLQTEFGR